MSESENTRTSKDWKLSGDEAREEIKTLLRELESNGLTPLGLRRLSYLKKFVRKLTDSAVNSR